MNIIVIIIKTKTSINNLYQTLIFLFYIMFIEMYTFYVT